MEEAFDMAGTADVSDAAVAADAESVDDAAAIEPAAPFFVAPLPEPGPEWGDVPVERLVGFFRNPCRFLLEQRLGLEVPRPEDELQDDEPFVVDVPGRTALARRLLPALLQGAGQGALRAMALAGTELPPGAFGAGALERELAALQRFAHQLRMLTAEPCLEPRTASLDFDLDGKAWHLHAAFADLRAHGLVQYRYDDLRPSDRLRAWLRHLVLCAAAPAGAECRTTVCARDLTVQLRPCADARAVLRTLLALYSRGLREPLAFFPKTAWAYVEGGDSLAKAAGAWKPTARTPWAEGADPACRLALRGRPDPLQEGLAEFHACAHAVFDPLREHLE